MAPYNQGMPEEDELEDIHVALNRNSNNKGNWDPAMIHCCFTDKNADLEAEGAHGVEVVSCDTNGVRCRAHLMKIVGLDRDSVDEEDEAAFENYADDLMAIVQGANVHGEWEDGEWVLHEEIPFFVEWVWKDQKTAVVDMDATAAAIEAQAKKELEPYVEELQLLDECWDRLIEDYARRTA
jgi:hypothetical protein